jgi:maltooligosyltrehalose trehalohydrolase
MTMATPDGAAMPQTRSPTLGAWLEGAGTRFRVWAPRARTIEVVVERPGAAPLVATLEASPDGHVSGLIPSAKVGGRYRYRIDGMGPFPRFRCRASGGLSRRSCDTDTL